MKIENYIPTQQEINELMKEGSDCFLSGHNNQNSPYPKGSEEHRIWIKGYNNAKFATILAEINAKHSD